MGWGQIIKLLNQANREDARVERFNEKWQRLNQIVDYVNGDFIGPLDRVADQMTEKELQKLQEYIADMSDWHHSINAHINEARQNHLSRYATAIKKTALKAMKLCQKYDVYTDIASVEYDGQRKMVLLNGVDQYYIC